jgi:hypothetical protein
MLVRRSKNSFLKSGGMVHKLNREGLTRAETTIKIQKALKQLKKRELSASTERKRA